MNLVELMEIWRLKTGNQNNLDYLYGIFDTAALDVRINREALALEILNECGTMTPRFMDTQFFATMAANFFTIKEREIKRDLDALDLEYNPLETYYDAKEGTRRKVDKFGRTTTRTDDLTEHMENGQQVTTHKVSADNESDFQNRTQDIIGADDDEKTNTGTQTHADSGKNIYRTKTTDLQHGRREAAQRLLSSELEANKVNIYKLLALDFAKSLMVCVY